MVVKKYYLIFELSEKLHKSKLISIYLFTIETFLIIINLYFKHIVIHLIKKSSFEVEVIHITY